MNKARTDEDLIPPEFEPLFEALLLQFDAALFSGDRPGSVSTEQKAGLPEGLLEELDATQSCLRLLHQMQSQSGIETGSEQEISPREIISPQAGGTSGDVIGRFEIERKLGEGTYGLVFLARDLDLNRRVALKIPRPEALVRPDLRERFLREAQAAASLSHPGIVAVYEASAANGLHYIASEFIDGPNLGEWLAAHQGPVDPRLAADLIASIADGVGHAHACGILHRDIKPGNILLVPKTPGTTSSGSLDDFEPKLTDFGLAKTAGGSNGTLSGTIMGTPAYMAPEQISGKLAEVGPTADVYSLGVVLCELLLGKNPFVGEGYEQTLHKVLHDECPALRRIDPLIPKDLAAICGTCLHKDPLPRYRSAADLAGDLRRFLQGKPILARSVSITTRLQKWCRRNPWLAIAGCVSLLSVLVLLVATLRHNAELLQANARIEQERDDAEKERQGAIASRELALRNQRLALKMMQNLVTSVQQKLATRPAMDGVRRELLQTAQQGLEELAREADGSTSDITNAYLLSVVELTGVYMMYGEASKCGDLLSRALQTGNAEAKKFPDDEELQRIIAALHQTNGSFHSKIGRMDVAIAEFQADLSIREALAKRHPGDKTRRLAFGKSVGSLGHAYSMVGNHETALKYYREAVAIQQELFNAGDHNPELIYPLTFSQRRVGDLLLLNFGQNEEARKSYSAALANVQLGMKEDPANHRLWLARTGIHRGLGDTAVRQGDRTTARKEYLEYLDWSVKLLAVDPSSDRSIRETLVAYERMGDFEGEEGKWQEARKAWLEELRLVNILVTRGPEHIDHHSNTLNLVHRFLALGDLPNALAASELSQKMVDAAAKLGSTNPTYLSLGLEHAINRGQIIKRTEDYNAGNLVYQTAVELADQACQVSPGNVNAQLTLTHALYNAGAFQILFVVDVLPGEERLKRAAEILKSIPTPSVPSQQGALQEQLKLVARMQAIATTTKEINNLEAIRQQPADSHYDLMMIRGRKAFQEKNIAKAIQTADALTELPESNLQWKFEAACILERCAGIQKADSEKLHQKAVQILEKCAAEGHFKNLWNMGQYLSRPELESLRGHLPQSSPLTAYHQYLSAVQANSQPRE